MARKRLIRKQALWDKVRSYPLDILLSINEQRLSIDWDDHIPQCLPVGSTLSLIFLLLCKIRTHFIFANEKRDNMLFRSDYTTYQQVVARAASGISSVPIAVPTHKSESLAQTLLWLVNALILVLFAIATLNTVNVYYLPYKNYTLLGRSASSPKPKASIVTKQSVSTSKPRGLLQNIFSYFEEQSFYETDSESEADTTYEPRFVEKDVWMMSVWDPAPFLLYSAASFSPIVLSFVWLINSLVSLWKIVIFIVLLNSFAVYVTSKFLQLISDKHIIHQETFNEYNKKYVIPKTSVLRKNASVDATHGRYAPASKTVHDDPVGHLQNDLAFVTHDINGTRHKSVRADFLDNIPSRSVSPAKNLTYGSTLPLSRGSRYESSMNGIGAGPTFYDDTNDQCSMMMLSTPFSLRNAGNELFLQRPDTFSRANETYSRGYDSFSQKSSRTHSPFKSPSRLNYNPNISYSERTQLSPNRSSRQLSPQRSPSPSKRVWH